MSERSEILEMMAVLQLSVCGQLVLGGGEALESCWLPSALASTCSMFTQCWYQSAKLFLGRGTKHEGRRRLYV